MTRARQALRPDVDVGVGVGARRARMSVEPARGIAVGEAKDRSQR